MKQPASPQVSTIRSRNIPAHEPSQVVDIAKVRVALPGGGYFVVRFPAAEFFVHPGSMFVREVFDSALQGPADTVERISIAAARAKEITNQVKVANCMR